MIKPYLLPLFAVATLFPRLLSLPAPFQQVQLTELLFPLLLVAFRKELWEQVRRFPTFSVAAGLYALVNVLSASWAGHAGAMLEAGARGYLLVLVFLVAAHVAAFGRETLVRWWMAATTIVCTGCMLWYAAIVGWGAPDPLRLVTLFPQYPYLGRVYRLGGPAQVYGMWYMLVLPGLLFAYVAWRKKHAPLWPVIVIALTGLLTLGKENLLLPIGILLLEAAWVTRRSVARGLRAVALTLSIVMLLATHFLLVRVDSQLLETAFTSGQSVAQIGQYTVVETNYTTNKRAAVEIGLANPLLGVGPGRYASHTEALVATGNYPAHYGRFDPHSAWTGAFAETGLLGLLALCGLVVALCVHRPAHLTTAAVLLLLILLTSVFKDVMNFRGLWVMVGLYLSDTSHR